MGIKSGRFTGRNGHEYEVALIGDSVVTDTINLGIPPATISMAAGEHKFCGFKSTTATVNILTDVPLIELYSAGVTDIRLTITDTTTNSIEFDGYVTPFAFDQPYTGKGDTFTVNAVDMLTARKGVKYVNETGNTVPQPYGTDRYALEIIKGIATRAGIYKIVEHINFNGTADLNTSPLNVKVAQAGFLQDEVSELDALSSIAKFFGFTSCVLGDTLYLYDEHCLLRATEANATNANVYEMGVLKGHYYDRQDTPLGAQYIGYGDVRNDISITIERAYDGIQITPEGSDVSVLLPDVCEDRYLTDAPDVIGSDMREDYMQVGNTDELYVARRIPAYSSLINLGNGASGGVTTWPQTSGDYMRPNDGINQTAGHWDSGSMMVQFGLARISDV